jgi:protoheme IX farnesyltransferase
MRVTRHRSASAIATLRVDVNPMRLFHGSITYLTVLFLAVALDPLVHISF